MKKVIHILTGWFRSYIYAPERIKTLSEKRLEACRECPFAKPVNFLKIREDGSDGSVLQLACSECGCPVLEKSLVEAEKCPFNLWEK